MMKNLCAQAAESGYRIGLIGGRNGLAVETQECLRKKYHGLKIKVFGEPEIKISRPKADQPLVEKSKIQISKNNSEKYFEKLVEEINNKKIDILFVALGFPKQEFFISRLSLVAGRLSKNRPLIMMGVGGSFDVLSGLKQDAPRWTRRGFEWIYRLIQDPRNLALWKRYLVTNPWFVYKVMITRLCNGRG